MRGYKTHQERHEYEAYTSPDEDRADGRNIPMDARVLSCPSQPKGAHYKTRCTYHRTIEPFFGWRKPLPLPHQPWIVQGTENIDHSTQCCTNPDTNEDQPVLPKGEATRLDEDDRNSFKHYQ